jgi:hypothetical protein
MNRSTQAVIFLFPTKFLFLFPPKIGNFFEFFFSLGFSSVNFYYFLHIFSQLLKFWKIKFQTIEPWCFFFF